MEEFKKEFRIAAISKGTVIDHIVAGRGLDVLRILGITGTSEATMSMVINVPSKVMGQKDIVKIENRELEPQEVDKIALIAPNATINIIREYGVVDKHKVKLPEQIEGIVKCGNLNCISNTSEPVTSKFTVVNKTPVELRCGYCDCIISSDNIAAAIL